MKLHLKAMNVMATVVGWFGLLIGAIAAMVFLAGNITVTMPYWFKPAIVIAVVLAIMYLLCYGTVKDAKAYEEWCEKNKDG